jgi:hypothetical protein
MYTIENLDTTEYETLLWLSNHGYDAGLYELTCLNESEYQKGVFVFEPIPEHVAWAINEAINDDPDAFLACNGSRSLADKLYTFINSIV